MYDLIDIIDTKLDSINHLIEKWMIQNPLVKISILNDINLIKLSIDQYHNKYTVCENYLNGKCKFGRNCWYAHPTSINNNINNNSQHINKNQNQNQTPNHTQYRIMAQHHRHRSSKHRSYLCGNTDSDSDDSDYDVNASKYHEADDDDEWETLSDCDADDVVGDQPFEEPFEEPQKMCKDNKLRNDSGSQHSEPWSTVKKRKQKTKSNNQQWLKKEETENGNNNNINNDNSILKGAALQRRIKRAKGAHLKFLIKFYKKDICYKCMNGNCANNGCKYFHPPRCNNYRFSNNFVCKFKDKCKQAHITFKYEPNGKTVTNPDSYKNNNNNKDNMHSRGFWKIKPKDNTDNNAKNNNQKKKKKMKNGKAAARQPMDERNSKPMSSQPASQPSNQVPSNPPVEQHTDQVVSQPASNDTGSNKNNIKNDDKDDEISNGDSITIANNNSNNNNNNNNMTAKDDNKVYYQCHNCGTMANVILAAYQYGIKCGDTTIQCEICKKIFDIKHNRITRKQALCRCFGACKCS